MVAKKGTVLYIGGFELPDKNAAAQRVVGNAYALEQLGYDVLFLNKNTKIDDFKFKCIDSCKRRFTYLFSAKEPIKIIKENKITHVIAYNYPAIALKKIIKYCKKNNVKCYADATEWYEAKGNIIKKALKKYDVDLRMKKLHKRMDGVIAISEYLYNYYHKDVKTVKIPPLVNVKDEKWKKIEKYDKEKIVFSYVGSPSARKERLDLVVKEIENISKKRNVLLLIVGITKTQFEQMYLTKVNSKAIIFKGRISHKEAVKIVKQSNWSIIMRENYLFVKAGFPTKVVESISCGTPVLANKFSNIEDYLNESNSILFDCYESLLNAIERACEKNLQIDNTIFYYTKYLDKFTELFDNVN